MKMFNRSAPRARMFIALPVIAATAVFAACDDDDPTFPSTGAVADLMIQKVPQGVPSLMIEEYGDNLRLLGVPVDDDGMFVDQAVTWESSRPSLATITTTEGADGRTYGLLEFAANPSYQNATNVDTITVTASSAGLTEELEVIVRELPRVEEVEMTGVSPFHSVGTELTLEADPMDAFGNVIDAPSDWTWATSAASVVSVVDNEDGTATITIEGEGAATVSASVVNAGESVAVGTITGTTDVTVLPEISEGTTFLGDITSGALSMRTVEVPAGASSLTVSLSGDTTGDADLMVHPPGAALFDYSCSGFTASSDESCTIANPTAGTWGIVVEAWSGAADVTGISVTVEID